jgi:hypothetical protein
MTQRPPDLSDTTRSDIPEPVTRSGKQTKQMLRGFWESLDHLGQGLMGDLWRTVYLSIQDAIALAVLLKLPSLVGQLIISKDFSSFDLCLKENPFGVARYACYIIVTSDFLLWILLGFRILGRFISGLREQWQDIKDKNDGSNES